MHSMLALLILGVGISGVVGDLTYPQNIVAVRYKQPSYYPAVPAYGEKYRYAEPVVVAPRYGYPAVVQPPYQPAGYYGSGYAPTRPYYRSTPYYNQPAPSYYNAEAYPAVPAYHPDAYATVSTYRQDDGYGNGVHAVSHTVTNGPGSHQTVYKKQQH